MAVGAVTWVPFSEGMCSDGARGGLCRRTVGEVWMMANSVPATGTFCCGVWGTMASIEVCFATRFDGWSVCTMCSRSVVVVVVVVVVVRRLRFFTKALFFLKKIRTRAAHVHKLCNGCTFDVTRELFVAPKILCKSTDELYESTNE